MNVFQRRLPLLVLALLLIGTTMAARDAAAALSPLAFSIIPPVQFPPDSFDVTGLRASVLWGQHREVYGFDLGVIGNRTDVGFTGLAVAGGFNYNAGTATVVGLQAAGITNINVNKTHIVGLQLALGLNSNRAESTIVGFALASVNYGPSTNVYGVQAGLYNRARTVNGFQIGIVNDCDFLHGIQIGLLNIHRQGLFAMAPIINIGF